ncbi:MAG: hypothetical protein ACREBJ_05330 [Nitrosotalea sp.]
MSNDEENQGNQTVRRFERLELLKNDCEELAMCARSDDQIGFQQNQEMSGLVFQIDNGVATPETMTRLSNVFREYNSSWLEHLRKQSSLIRKFSSTLADELDVQINQVETETRGLIEEISGMSGEELLGIQEHVSLSIKNHGHSFGILFNRCKITVGRIKTDISAISDVL